MWKRQENAARRIFDCGQNTAADLLIKTYSVTVIILLRSLLHRVSHFFGFLRLNSRLSGFGGLEVACWPLAPKFAGSHSAEAVRFLGRNNPQHAFHSKGM
jgi:hypothetical protein